MESPEFLCLFFELKTRGKSLSKKKEQQVEALFEDKDHHYNEYLKAFLSQRSQYVSTPLYEAFVKDNNEKEKVALDQNYDNENQFNNVSTLSGNYLIEAGNHFIAAFIGIVINIILSIIYLSYVLNARKIEQSLIMIIIGASIVISGFALYQFYMGGEKLKEAGKNIQS